MQSRKGPHPDYTEKRKVTFANGTEHELTLYRRCQVLAAWIIRHSRNDCPEARLMVAILCRAVRDFGTHAHDPQFWVDGRAEEVARATYVHLDRLYATAEQLGIQLTSPLTLEKK